LDAHPLIREYFGNKLREKNLEGWRSAHRRLYEHLKNSTKDKPQPTLEDLQPLYQAVAHGCQAGMQQEVCNDVYYIRIQRGGESYSSKRLGALGADLGAVACFFEQPWTRVSSSLTEAAQAWLLNAAAYRLRALGRLTEALEPMRAALEMGVKQERWRNAAISAQNVSELDLSLGRIAVAVAHAEEGVKYADKSSNEGERRDNRAAHANALHQAGHRAEAEAHFHEAETMQAEKEPDYPVLYSVRGFCYCDLLLSAPESAAWQVTYSSVLYSPEYAVVHRATLQSVSQRAAQTIKWAEQHNLSLLDIALDHLTLGRAVLYKTILEGSSVDPCHAFLRYAVEGFRVAGQQRFIPFGLLTRAWLRTMQGQPDLARVDLDEAWEIAVRGPMRLHMADIHLYRARLFCKVKPYPWTSPREDLASARKLIEACGYWRRKEELDDSEAAAKNW
jgi:tetratricopeptide (TPR) repeat protein